MNVMLYGFRVVGHRANARRLVDWRAAFTAYAECDERATPDREAYLSHFQFGNDFKEHLEQAGSEKGYNGPCGTSWLFWDVDRTDLEIALADTRRLVGGLLDRYRELDDDDLLTFLSGGKGFHVGIPCSIWNPEPSLRFHEVAKRFAFAHAERAGIVVDGLIYSKTRLFRAPNSRHPKSGLFKRRLTHRELMHLKPGAIVEMARNPEPFAIPAPTVLSSTAAIDWNEAAEAIESRTVRRRIDGSDDSVRLTRMTLDFIREGATNGERASKLFQAAANLGEFDCPPALAHALLTEAALDSGLSPSETKRQIDCGLTHVRRQQEGVIS